MKSNRKEELAEYGDALNSFGKLNFAFCPSIPLSSNFSKSSPIFKEIKKILSQVGITNRLQQKEFIENTKYFYICYSLSIKSQDSEDYETSQDYFYFQTFAQFMNINIPCPPVYGFFSKEEILTLIREIDFIFQPEFHDKQIFSEYLNSEGTCALLIKAMQNWTSVKLIDFNSKVTAGDSVVEKAILQKNKPKKQIKKDENEKIEKRGNTKKSKTVNKKEKTCKSNRVRKSEEG